MVQTPVGPEIIFINTYLLEDLRQEVDGGQVRGV